MIRRTTDEAALLAAICDAPDDDAPRLVYADYLDENGRSPRAEFIRLQVRMAEVERLGGVSPWAGFELHAAAGRLLADHRADWLRELPGWVREPARGDPTRVGYRRGMVEEVRMEGGALLAQGAGLFAVAPVRTVTFLALKRAEAFARWPFLHRLTELSLRDLSIGDAGAASLAYADGLCGVRTLDLTGCGLTDAGLLALANSRHLSALDVLKLSSVGVSPSGVRELLHRLPVKQVRFPGREPRAFEWSRLRVEFGKRLWFPM